MRPLASLARFSPVAIRKESERWQIIWCADICPQRLTLSGRTDRSRRMISALQWSRARVFMLGPFTRPTEEESQPDQPLPASLAECVECSVAARLRFLQ